MIHHTRDGGFIPEILSDDISAIAYGVAFRPCAMSHFVYSHWLAQPHFSVLVFFSHLHVSSHSLNQHDQLTPYRPTNP